MAQFWGMKPRLGISPARPLANRPCNPWLRMGSFLPPPPPLSLPSCFLLLGFKGYLQPSCLGPLAIVAESGPAQPQVWAVPISEGRLGEEGRGKEIWRSIVAQDYASSTIMCGDWELLGWESEKDWGSGAGGARGCTCCLKYKVFIMLPFSEKWTLTHGLKMFLVFLMSGSKVGGIICFSQVYKVNTARVETRQPIPELTSSLSVCIFPPLITNRRNIRGEMVSMSWGLTLARHTVSLSVCGTREGDRLNASSSVWLCSSINFPGRIIRVLLKVHRIYTDIFRLPSGGTCAAIQRGRSVLIWCDIWYIHIYNHVIIYVGMNMQWKP